MAKSGYKKFKKQEKARVKLKGNKALLPKGQNITDTSFKVKKIVLKEQLKEHAVHELLTKKHLSFKDLITRLNHHNVSMRREALSGLKELISVHGSDIMQTNLSSLLQATMTLTVDKESEVRKETLKLLTVIFENVSEKELSPLFSVVICHLTCTMTHIEPGVRSDSLQLLDAMLAALPALTAAHTYVLLPHFLDLISHQSSGQPRTLSLNLDGRVTSNKWRAKVIGRLNRLFSVLQNHIKKDQTQNSQSMKWSADKRTYLELYSPVISREEITTDVKNIPIQEYSQMLMPLLLDTFTEAVPKQNKDESQTACVVTVDVIGLLQSIVEVILHIWSLLKQSRQTGSMTDWFTKTWGEPVAKRMFRNHFPYSVATANSRKRKRDSDQILAALQVSEPSCSLLNLQLCLLVFLLTRPNNLWTQSIQFIKKSLRVGGSLKSEESAVLCQCLEAALSEPTSIDTSSLLQVISKSDILSNIDKPTNRMAFDYLSHIALQPYHHLHEDKNFTTWLDSLPALLCKDVVSLATVRKIAAISTRSLPAFSNSLDGWIEEILGHLPYLKVAGDIDNEGSRIVVNLVYWVKDWDQELAQSIKQLIQKKSLGTRLTSHLVDVLRLKAGSTEDIEMVKMVEEILED